MRTPLLVLLALAGATLAGLAPTAQAQWAGPQYHVLVSLTPPTEALTSDAPHLTLEGKVEFAGDPTMNVNLYGVPVSYEVTRAPAWLSVSLNPASDVIMLTSNGHSVTGSKTFTVTVDAAGGLPTESLTDQIEVTATVKPTSPMSAPRSASQSAPILFYVPEPEECEEHLVATAELVGPQAEPAEEEEPVTVQSGGVTPVGTWYAVAGFGLVGAGVGLLLRRRLR